MNQPMRQRAISQGLVPGDDASIFRTSLVSVTVDVLPQHRKLPNGDQIFRGNIGEKDIEIVVPANRYEAALPLIKHLQNRLRLAQVSTGGDTVASVRQKLRVDGVWRVRMMNETNATPERRFQLVAARWRYRGADGVNASFGHLPGL